MMLLLLLLASSLFGRGSPYPSRDADTCRLDGTVGSILASPCLVLSCRAVRSPLRHKKYTARGRGLGRQSVESYGRNGWLGIEIGGGLAYITNDQATNRREKSTDETDERQDGSSVRVELDLAACQIAAVLRGWLFLCIPFLFFSFFPFA